MPTKTASSFSRQASRKDPESLTALPKPRAAYRSGAESKEKILTQCKNEKQHLLFSVRTGCSCGRQYRRKGVFLPQASSLTPGLALFIPSSPPGHSNGKWASVILILITCMCGKTSTLPSTRYLPQAHLLSPPGQRNLGLKCTPPCAARTRHTLEIWWVFLARDGRRPVLQVHWLETCVVPPVRGCDSLSQGVFWV